MLILSICGPLPDFKIPVMRHYPSSFSILYWTKGDVGWTIDTPWWLVFSISLTLFVRGVLLHLFDIFLCTFLWWNLLHILYPAKNLTQIYSYFILCRWGWAGLMTPCTPYSSVYLLCLTLCI